tara:strand:- start:1395 stop:2204 length:810 start_codon:yes stop_codon:yes gene_type:complete
MPNLIDKKNNLEILISTTNKNNLDFIDNIFFQSNKSKYPILVVNQSDNNINSNFKNINVINSDSKGLSISRNLAIKNSSFDYCVFADDDIVYKEDFYTIISTSFKNNPNADIITFRMVDESGKLFKDYKNIEYHDERTIRDINSVVIAFKRESIIKNNLSFDPLFGLGSIFPTGDEYVFLMECLDKGLNIISNSAIILSHNSDSSGKMAHRDQNIFARAAIFYKFFGYLSYFKLIHHIYLLKKNNMIKNDQILNKFLVGIKGINKFKSI